MQPASLLAEIGASLVGVQQYIVSHMHTHTHTHTHMGVQQYIVLHTQLHSMLTAAMYLLASGARSTS